MADGEQIPAPPHHEVGVPPINSSLPFSKPPFFSPSAQGHHTSPPSAIITQTPSLEDGEIPPLLASDVLPISFKQLHPISYSNIVQGHKEAPPVSAFSSIDPEALCQDNLSLKPLSVFEGKPCVLFKSSEKKILISNQKFVLVGKFSHGRPPLSAIKVFFSALKLQGRYNLSIFDNKHLFIELYLKIDYVRVWLKLNWSIAGFAMRIFKWGSDFSPVKESAIAPVWVRIEGVPLYLFDKLSLLSIANAIGQPLSVHPLNVNRVKLNSALICVELDVSIPLMDSIYVCFEDDISLRPVEGIWLKVFYDVVPRYCSACLHIGHHLDVCKKGQSVSLAEVIQPVGKLGSGISALKVFDGSSQPAAPSISAPSVSFLAGVNHKVEQKASQSQIWIEVQGSNVHKKTSSHKDKDLLTENKFSSLLLADSCGSDSCVDTSVLLPRSAKYGEAQTVLQVGNVAIPQDASVVPPSTNPLDDFVLSNSPGMIEKAGIQDSGRKEVEGSVAPIFYSSLGKAVHHKLVTGVELDAFDPTTLGLESVLVSANTKGEIHQIVQATAGENTSAITPSSDSLVVSLQNIVVSSEQPSQITQASEVIPADASSNEQIGGLAAVKELHSGSQKELQVDYKEVSDAPEVCISEAESASVSVRRHMEDGLQATDLAFSSPSTVAPVACSAGVDLGFEVAPVTSSEQLGEPSSTPPKSWATMVEEEELEAKKIAHLKAITGEKLSSKLVKNSGPDTCKDLITNPVKANFYERVAQKDHNEGLALKIKTKTATRVDTKRFISQDDSKVYRIKSKPDNPLHAYKEAGYRLIARRSLSPTGRSSPKLISLRKKLDLIHICEENTILKDVQEYSEEYQADVERVRSSKKPRPGDKLPTPNGPGQNKQRRNRGRNRGSYGTPDRSQKYHTPGTH